MNWISLVIAALGIAAVWDLGRRFALDRVVREALRLKQLEQERELYAVTLRCKSLEEQQSRDAIGTAQKLIEHDKKIAWAEERIGVAGKAIENMNSEFAQRIQDLREKEAAVLATQRQRMRGM